MNVVTIGPKEVRSIVSMPDAIEAVRNGFLALARGEFEMPTRTALRDGAFLVMSAHHRPTASAMVKTFDGRDPAIAGTVVWSELGHGVHLVADAGEVTRLRTGAAVGVATELMAPVDARTCTVIGAGGQAADQVRAVHAVRPLSRLTIVAAHGTRAEHLATSLAPELPRTAIDVGTSAEDAVGAADIVCCATTATSPLFRLDALRDTVHVNAIGAFRPTMRELPDELLADATVVIDERGAILAESGEVIHALRAGLVTEDDLTELGSALTRGLPERTGRTAFKSVGLAVQDWAIAALLAQRCLRTD